MEQLKQYKKLTKIRCLAIGQGPNPALTFQVKFEQPIPHSLFKYTIIKSRDELMRLFERLEGQIFDLDNPFNQHFLSNLTKPSMKPLESINNALEECTARLDILIHHHFINFFSIHVHYPDFMTCLREEMLSLDLCQEKKSGKTGQNKEKKQGFDLEKGWIGQKPPKIEKNDPSTSQDTMEKPKGKPSKQVSEFESMINLINLQEEGIIQTSHKQIIDFICINYYQKKFLIILEEQKKGTKISSFIKTFFSDSKPLGYLSIHKKDEGNQYSRKFTAELSADPISMEHNTKTNMIMTLTTVGVYVHLIKMEHNHESIQLFSFISLTGTADIANNCFLGEVYLVRRAAPHKLYVYGLKDEALKELQYRYKNASSICFEQGNSRLFVSDETGIYIYLVGGGLDIKRLHFLKTDEGYINLSEKLGYLYCINSAGLLTVIEIKPPQKEQLMSITTTIGIPAGTKRIVGSKSQRVIVSCYKDCVVLIDTQEGPLAVLKVKGQASIKAIFYDKENGKLISMSEEGKLAVLTINKRIQ